MFLLGELSDGAVIRALHCKPPGCRFKSSPYLQLCDVSPKESPLTLKLYVPGVTNAVNQPTNHMFSEEDTPPNHKVLSNILIFLVLNSKQFQNILTSISAQGELFDIKRLWAYLDKTTPHHS